MDYVVLLAAIGLATCSVSAHGAAIIDDFNDRDGWRGPIYQYGDRATGGASIASGILTITHAPKGRYHMVSMERDFTVDFKPNTWIHCRFRMHEPLLGADMYTTFTLDGKCLLQMGINGEQQWRMFANCVAKDWDDELFFGSEVIRGEESGKRTDIRVGLSALLKAKVRYTDWHVFSVKYHVNGRERTIRLFVDGCEIAYRDLDMPFPRGAVDNRALDDFRPPPHGSKLTVSFGIMTDGDLYGDTSVNDGAGVRWLHAFADNTPAIPSPTDPRAAVKKHSRMFWDYVIVVSEQDAPQIRPQIDRLVAEDRFPASLCIARPRE